MCSKVPLQIRWNIFTYFHRCSSFVHARLMSIKETLYLNYSTEISASEQTYALQNRICFPRQRDGIHISWRLYASRPIRKLVPGVHIFTIDKHLSKSVFTMLIPHSLIGMFLRCVCHSLQARYGIYNTNGFNSHFKIPLCNDTASRLFKVSLTVLH